MALFPVKGVKKMPIGAIAPFGIEIFYVAL